jgi:hypothetical protein
MKAQKIDKKNKSFTKSKLPVTQPNRNYQIHSERARNSKPTNQNKNLRFRIKTHKPNQI